MMIMLEIITKVYPLILTVLQIMLLVAIKMNDLKHISDEIQDIKKVVDEINKKILDHECRIAKLEGKLNGKSN
jgi:hypothetical protein